MYENQTYEKILERTLKRVATDIDKSEGSLVMNAIAPVSAEHASIYILLDGAIRDGYADTATREYLILRAKERGIYPDSATYAQLKGKFNMEIPIGSRFNLNELNYKATAFIESVEGFYYYTMECETIGTSGNKYTGALSSIEYIHKDLTGELVEVTIPARDEESTESLRAKYFNSFESSAFGGNMKDYQKKCKELGAGGAVVVPVWAGGGTVKLVIIDTEYNVASTELVTAIQQSIDPIPQGTGTGWAPIGHTVTVVPATKLPVNIKCSFSFHDGYDWDKVNADITGAVKAYLLEKRKAWEEGNIEILIADITTVFMSVTGVKDVSGITLNNKAENLLLTPEELPVLGGVTNG